MNEHGKKMIAPIIITILVIAYYVLYFSLIISTIDIRWVKLCLGILPIALAGTSIYVCIQRIHEIRSGEEDDLNRY